MRIAVLFLAALLAACQAAPPPAPAPVQPPAPDAGVLMLGEWLREADAALQLTAREARERLAATKDEAASPTQRFRVALLHQQAGGWDSWVLARDAMRELHAEEALPPDVRRLAGLLESLNQAQINAAQQRNGLRRELAGQAELLAGTQRELEALQEKVRALSSLEDSMRQRRDAQAGTP